MRLAARLARLEATSQPPARTEMDSFYADGGWYRAAPDAVLRYYETLWDEACNVPHADTDRAAALVTLHERHPLLRYTIHWIQCAANKGEVPARLRHVQRYMIDDAHHRLFTALAAADGRLAGGNHPQWGAIYDRLVASAWERLIAVSAATIPRTYGEHCYETVVALWRAHGTRDTETLTLAGLGEAECALLDAD